MVLKVKTLVAFEEEEGSRAIGREEVRNLRDAGYAVFFTWVVIVKIHQAVYLWFVHFSMCNI